MCQITQTVDNKIEAPKEVLALKYEKAPEVIEPPKIPSPPPEPEKVEVPETQSESSNLLVIFKSLKMCSFLLTHVCVVIC